MLTRRSLLGVAALGSISAQAAESWFAGKTGESYDSSTGRVSIQRGMVGGQPGGGVIGFTDVGIDGATAARLTYRVQFAPDFPFRRGTGIHRALGGKLPGLYGTGPDGRLPIFSPTNIPDGTRGFNARPLFLAGDADEGGVNLYVWDMKAGPWGRGGAKTIASAFVPGQTYTVDLTCVLNSLERDDGLVSLRIDGQTVVELSGFKARIVDDVRLRGCSFAVFFGGNTPDWASYRDTWIRISDLRAERIGS